MAYIKNSVIYEMLELLDKSEDPIAIQVKDILLEHFNGFMDVQVIKMRKYRESQLKLSTGKTPYDRNETLNCPSKRRVCRHLIVIDNTDLCDIDKSWCDRDRESGCENYQ